MLNGSEDDIPPPPPSQTPTQQTPHTVSTIKLPIPKKGEYDIWAIKMEHYLAHTDYPIWEVIQRGNGPVSVSTDTNGLIKVLPPKTAEEILARERERKSRTTLLMALPEDHLAKFHKMTDAKEMWEAIKSRFGGNDESKKMQKYILKQQFEGFPNVAFVSENTSNTNDVSTAYGVSNSFGHNSQYEHTSSYSLLENQSSCPQLDHEDLEQLDEFNLEEIDLKWAVVIRQGILLKNANPKGIKIVGGEILRTLEIRIKKMGEDLVNRRTGMKRIFKKRNKKKAKSKQNRARNEKDKVRSHPSEENTT
ncbi:hypothetical protein Tco_0493146 [Tanacetum coccineum]